MATLAARRLLLPRWVAGGRVRLLGTAAEASPGGEEAGGGRGDGGGSDGAIYVKKPAAAAAVTTRDETSVAMPTSFMTGSVVGKRFYRDATVRLADDGNGWTVMLDYRTLKSPAKRPLKLPSRALAMAIAAEWEYQVLILSPPSLLYSFYGSTNSYFSAVCSQILCWHFHTCK
jgi:ATP synthase F1 complex assembly factor 2